MEYLNLTIRLGFEKKDHSALSSLVNWLESNYIDECILFLKRIFTESNISFVDSITSGFRHTKMIDPLINLRHAVMDNKGNWFLDEIKLKNSSTIYIKIDNQWIFGKVIRKGTNYHIHFEPEGFSIPMSEDLFLNWMY